jgi:hypothetical protein
MTGRLAARMSVYEQPWPWPLDFYPEQANGRHDPSLTFSWDSVFS